MVNLSIKMLVLASGFEIRLRSVLSSVTIPMPPVKGVQLFQLQLDHWINTGKKNYG